MRRWGRPKALALVGVVSLALVSAACSSDDDGGGTQDRSGEIVVSGSSTVQPITSLVGEEFAAENPNVQISVDGPGTGDGFELFCNGETDISDASRPIESDEAKACKKNGITYTELKIGLDGITVMTNPANEAITCLDDKDLYALVGPESEGFENWSDANKLGQELGAGHVPYPDVPLDITAPGEESGTYDAFIELAGFEDIGVERGLSEDEAATTRPDYQSSPNDNVIIQGIEGSDSSFGWVGFAYYEENAGQIKAIEIDGGDGCVAPARETIEDSSYPLSRALYIYVNNENASSNESLTAFVDFYMSDVGIRESVTQAGYVDLPDDQIQQTVDTWEQQANA